MGAAWGSDGPPPVPPGPSLVGDPPTAGREGILALTLRPDGTSALGRLPEGDQWAAAELSRLVGGPLEVILGPSWCAYLDEDGHRHGAAPNWHADRLARLLGWAGNSDGEPIRGPVVFLGRAGRHGEADVPPYVVNLAGTLAPADSPPGRVLWLGPHAEDGGR